MSDTPREQHSLPVWIMKHAKLPNGRGRQHAALFIPNAATDTHPIEGANCEGTLYEVRGSPMFGFAHEILRNWDSATSAGLENAVHIGLVKQQHVYIPTRTGYHSDTERRCEMDKIALNVRPPGVSKQLWVAENIMDCQDWLLDLVEQMVRHKIITREALTTARSAIDPKEALMEKPSGAPPAPGQSTAPAAMPITSSTIQATRSIYQPNQEQQPQSQGQASSSRQFPPVRVSQSAWNSQRGRWERVVSGGQEYMDSKTNKWLPLP